MVNPLGRSNPMRMMGMASGMDTDFIIQQSMRVHQMRIDNQMRARTNLQWRMDTHNDVRTQVNNFRNTFLTTQGNQGMLNRNVFNANVASTIGANSAAVSVRALGGSATGSIRIGAINQLATGASVRTSDAARAAFQNTQASARLSTLPGLGLGQRADDRVELEVGDDTVRMTRAAFNSLNWNDATEVSRISLGNSVDSSHRNIAITRTPVAGSPGEFTYTFTAGPDDNRISGTISFSEVQDTNEDGSLMYDEDGQAVMVTRTNVSIDNQPAEGEANYALANSIQAALTSQISQNDEGAIQRNNSALTFNQELVVTAPNAEGEATEFTLTRSSATADGVTTHTVSHNGTVINSDSFFRNQTININGTNVELRSNMTISQMLNAVNTQVSNVRMSFEPLTGRFNLENLNTGADSTLDLTVNLQQRTGESDEAFAARQAAAPTQADNEAFFSVLGFTPTPEQARDADGNLLFDENDDPIMNNSLVFQGQNAVAYVNGDKIVSANNTFNFGGVAITLNSVNLSGGTGAIDDPESVNNITINIARDTDGVVDRIRSFIDAYNSIIQRIETLTRERRAPHEMSYQPLTDEEKSGMTDRQIEQWEEIARRGIMRNDSALTNLASSLRRELFVSVEQAGLSPHQIGLSTGAFHSGTGGQIVLDEDRLRSALEADPERVANVFAGTEGNRGLLWRMNEVMTQYTSTNGSGSRAIRGLEDSIRRNMEQVNRMQVRMFAEEDRLFRQFAAMETAMSRMQSQGDWFTAMLGGL